MLVSFPKPPENCNAMIKLSINVLNNLKRISDVVLPIHSYEGKNTLNAWSSLETGPFCSHTVVLSCNTTLFPILSLFHIIYIYTHIYIYIYTHIYIYHYCVWRKRAEWSLASGFVYSIHVTVFLFRQFKFHSDWIFAFLNFWFIIRTELIIHLDLLLNYLLVH